MKISRGDMYDIRFIRMCPRHLGLGASRTRFWAICVRKDTARWMTAAPLKDLIEVFCCEPVMNAALTQNSSNPPSCLLQSVLSNKKIIKVPPKRASPEKPRPEIRACKPC